MRLIIIVMVCLLTQGCLSKISRLRVVDKSTVKQAQRYRETKQELEDLQEKYYQSQNIYVKTNIVKGGRVYAVISKASLVDRKKNVYVNHDVVFQRKGEEPFTDQDIQLMDTIPIDLTGE